MSIQMLLFVAVFVFSLMIVGLILVMLEFSSRQPKRETNGKQPTSAHDPVEPWPARN